MKIEAVDGFIRLENDNAQAIWISEENAWEVLEFLADRKDTLFARVHHLQRFPQAEAEAPETVEATPARTDKGEPLLEDCPWCKGAHQAGTISQCPLNPNRPEVAYRAMEAALKLLTGNILNLRTELLVIKAEVMKGDEL